MNRKSVSENEGARVGAGDFAGMPQQVKMQAYPKNRGAAHRDLNDTMSGIDECINRSESKAQKNLSNQH
jgi:hypothetical protein